MYQSIDSITYDQSYNSFWLCGHALNTTGVFFVDDDLIISWDLDWKFGR